MDIAVVVEDKTGQNQNKVKTDLSKTKVPKINKKITEWCLKKKEKPRETQAINVESRINQNLTEHIRKYNNNFM